jgi:hypothetical protein
MGVNRRTVLFDDAAECALVSTASGVEKLSLV